MISLQPLLQLSLDRGTFREGVVLAPDGPFWKILAILFQNGPSRGQTPTLTVHILELLTSEQVLVTSHSLRILDKTASHRPCASTLGVIR